MKILLDTVCWIWLLDSPGRIRAETRRTLSDRGNQVFLSAASAWEIALKAARGKLRLPEQLETWMPVRMRENAVTALPIDQRHCFRATSLPAHHRDPFDRLLIAQAQIEELAVATSDGDFAAYAIDVIPL